jgi:hypothetical protein
MKPTWWLLYAIGISLMGVFALVEIFVPEEGVRSVLQIAVVVMGFGLMACWNRRNRVAMELDECRRRRGAVGQCRPVPIPSATKAAGQRGSSVASPLLSEITGRARR